MTPGMLSVVMGNYNHAAYVGVQIAAILGQSYRNIELIVLDDKSTDNSIAVIEAAIGQDSRARLIKNEKNLGAVMNQEKGRALMQGEFLYFAAADDCVLPGFFEKSISLLQRHPQAGVSFTVMAWIDPSGTRAQPMPLRLIPEPAYLSPEAFCEIICGEHITGHTSMYRAQAYAQALPATDEFKRLEWVGDWFMGSVIACRGGVCHTPEPLVAIRHTGANYGHGMYDWKKQKEVVYTILRLLKSETYRDVMPYFAQGQLLSNIGFVGRAVAANPEFWDVETLMMVQEPLVAWAMERQRKQKEHWQIPPQGPQGLHRT